MPPKTRTIYVCSNCGKQTPRYMGRCPACNEYNTMQEEVLDISRGSSLREGGKARPTSTGLPNTGPVPLNQITMDDAPRVAVPIEEINRVLGGGIVPGSISLIGGDPGIGKSTLIIQMSAALANSAGPVLYVSGEESARQIKMRADRMGLASENLYLVTETNLSTIFEHIYKLQPMLVIIDSIQTVYTEESESSPGSVSQVRECAARLQSLAKNSLTSVVLIGHVTKEGSIAGPRVLEHIVDTVLYLEGDPFGTYRILRSVKNRFGATSEIGVFEMTGEGMIEVPNPSAAFLAERIANAPGTAIAITMEGTRPLLVEVQALTSPTSYSNPRRTPNGIDIARLLLISAVLTKRFGLKLHEQDIFMNVIGGLKVDEPAADLAAALSMASSYYDKPLPVDMAFVGEIGLSGELRAAGQLPARLKEAEKMGFARVMVPKLRRRVPDLPEGVKLVEVRNLGEALAIAVPRD
ncbi:MAG: DNA repair protein RadA [Pleurocapsa minor GSE-CHR-MK-17-07R]|jgi:DNA repair protein RadA/Sms|nr:DNA repair protein RadA [Pleurocapsa minor GSE-CHR-MK 17-07R]